MPGVNRLTEVVPVLEHLRGALPIGRDAHALDEPARRGGVKMVFDEALVRHHVAVQQDHVFAARRCDSSIARASRAKAAIFLPDVMQRHAELAGPACDETGGFLGRSIVRDDHFIRHAPLARDGGEDEIESLRPVVGRDDQETRTLPVCGSSRLAPPGELLEKSGRAGRGFSTARVAYGRSKLFGKFLSQFHAPLIERIDTPDHALREHLVLVKRHQPPERSRVELRERHDGAGTVPSVDFVRNEVVHPLRCQFLLLQFQPHGRRRVPRHERFGLRKAVRDGEVLLLLIAGGRLCRQHEIQRRPRCSLMQKLEEGMLRIITRLAPDHSGRIPLYREALRV